MSDSERGTGLTRRDALKRGAVIGGAMWAVPAVQALHMGNASADAPSGSSGSKGKGKSKDKGAK